MVKIRLKLPAGKGEFLQGVAEYSVAEEAREGVVGGLRWLPCAVLRGCGDAFFIRPTIFVGLPRCYGSCCTMAIL